METQTQNLVKYENKFRFFWGWDDHNEEAWLRECSQQGRHLKTVHGMGFYTFEVGAPEARVYRMDFQDKSKKELGEYLQLFRDAGWEHVDEGLGWHYFRKTAAQAGADEIYTDPASKIQKYQRMQVFLFTMLPIFTVLFLAVDGDSSGRYARFVIGLFSVIVVFYVFALFKINARIRALKQL